MLPFFLFLSCMSGPENWRISLDDLNLPNEFIYGMLFPNISVSSDGTIVILDWAAKKLLILDRNGELKTSAGRRGRGPGEFSSPALMGWVSETNAFYVTDYANGRISLWGSDGLLKKEFSLLEPLKRPSFHSPTSLLYRKSSLGSRGLQPSIFLYDLKAGETSLFWKMTEKYEHESDYVTPVQESTIALPWHPRFHFHSGTDFIAVNYNSSKLVIVDKQTGKERAIFPVELPLTPLTDEYYEYNMSKMSTDQRAKIESQVKRPDYWPLLSRVIVDEKEKIWVAGHQHTIHSRVKFVVYDEHGKKLAFGDVSGIPYAVAGNAIYSVAPNQDEDLFLIKTHVEF